MIPGPFVLDVFSDLDLELTIYRVSWFPFVAKWYLKVIVQILRMIIAAGLSWYVGLNE